MAGQILECSLAKPQSDQKSSGGSNSQKAAVLPTYPPPVGYGLVGATYGALGSGFGQVSFSSSSLSLSLSVSLSLAYSYSLGYSLFAIHTISATTTMEHLS
jgi:hypothetical protein